ncbi:MAG: LysR substrate-binding domain-containing protein [Pseudomonadota bacterium]
MSDMLPPLTALRAFEAAARHLSFQNAAAELNVTPAALSHQIKSIEERLDAPVFIRHNRRVELTDLGRVLQPGLAEGFEALQAAWSAALRKRNHKQLTVTAGPAFMASFLAPRMSDFVVAHPELEFRLTASLAMLNFQRDGIDLAIRFGGTSDEGYFSERIFQEWVAPMMSPERAQEIPQSKHLKPEHLIISAYGKTLAPVEDWGNWFTAAGLAKRKPTGPVFANPEGALSYAANGGGVALGRISIADGFVRSGRLVMPFATSMRAQLYYRLVCPLGMENDPPVRQFRDWMRAQVNDLDAHGQGRLFVDI